VKTHKISYITDYVGGPESPNEYRIKKRAILCGIGQIPIGDLRIYGVKYFTGRAETSISKVTCKRCLSKLKSKPGRKK
jgi:hypothetical protein